MCLASGAGAAERRVEQRLAPPSERSRVSCISCEKPESLYAVTIVGRRSFALWPNRLSVRVRADGSRDFDQALVRELRVEVEKLGLDVDGPR